MYVKKHKTDLQKLNAALLESPLGTLLALADPHYLYCLEFFHFSEYELQNTYATLRFEKNALLQMLEKELQEYFYATRTSFTIPLSFKGTSFQQKVWQTLQHIPYGKTISYKELADAAGKSSAFRAAANANGRNNFIVLVPCHRVININGSLGGYTGGIEKKQWLLEHEKQLLNRAR